MSAFLAHDIGGTSGLFLPIDDYLLFIAWGAERLSAPHLGLDIADQMRARDIGIYGYLIQNSPTVGDFCNLVEQYQAVFMRGMEFKFEKSDRHFWLQYQIHRAPCEGVRQDVELTLGGFLRLLRGALEDSIYPRKTAFSHARREPTERYEKTFGAEVSFGQEHSYLVFNIDLLQLPLSDSDPKLLAIFTEHADSLLEQLQSKQSLVGQIKLLIATSLENDDGGVEMLADRLHITRRTLSRRLQREGTNYQRLREEVIVELAKQSLDNSDASITAIAGKLGFSESSAFVRAFKRLVGSTPVAYRSHARQSFV
jgi:AraC-like DNA-binding protein